MNFERKRLSTLILLNFVMARLETKSLEILTRSALSFEEKANERENGEECGHAYFRVRPQIRQLTISGNQASWVCLICVAGARATCAAQTPEFNGT